MCKRLQISPLSTSHSSLLLGFVTLRWRVAGNKKRGCGRFVEASLATVRAFSPLLPRELRGMTGCRSHDCDYPSHMFSHSMLLAFPRCFPFVSLCFVTFRQFLYPTRPPPIDNEVLYFSLSFYRN